MVRAKSVFTDYKTNINVTFILCLHDCEQRLYDLNFDTRRATFPLTDNYRNSFCFSVTISSDSKVNFVKIQALKDYKPLEDFF